MNHKLTVISAMVGAMGSGKTTFALEIAQKKNAKFYSLDGTIKNFGLPIQSLKDYESHMQKALELIRSAAILELQQDRSVVFDFGGGMGHWSWLKSISDMTGAQIEIYQFDVPLNLRQERVKERNQTKPAGIYHFTMSDEEVIASQSKLETPPSSEKVRVFKVVPPESES